MTWAGEYPSGVPRYYTVGDEIRVTVEFEHYANIEAVRVIYATNRGSAQSTITLVGDSSDIITQSAKEDLAALSLKRSTATLVTLVDYDHQPGPYFFHLLVLHTVAGNLIPLLTKPPGQQGPAFHIEQESLDIPSYAVELENPSDPDEG